MSLSTIKPKEKMPTVNLDALIPREDFETTEPEKPGENFEKLSIGDLLGHNFILPNLRKPDFQRETSEWDAKKICDFLESFTNGDLIPSIIFWRSRSGYYFVIDGAHRLSALISWIKNDYGNGDISKKFYDENISHEQQKIDKDARAFINKYIGSYSDIQKASEDPNGNPEYIRRGKNIGAYAIRVQWVFGDATKAEDSFFKINQQGVKLDDTEIKLLHSRKKGNCIAARAIMYGGTGHKFWSNFPAENQKKIQETAQEIHKILFDPPLKTPVRTMNIPIAGKVSASQTLSLILDFVNIANQIPADFDEEKEGRDLLKDDTNGEETLKYLYNARKIAWRINSIHSSSLGLHPLVYFYSPEARHKPASFRAVVAWIVNMERANSYRQFISVRNIFEELLLKYDYVVQDIARRGRSSINSYDDIASFYSECIRSLNANPNIDAVVSEVIRAEKFAKLKLKIERDDQEPTTNPDFTDNKKSAVYVRDALKAALICNVCNARLPEEKMHVDHIERKSEGGVGSVENGQLLHPYCNSTIKH